MKAKYYLTSSFLDAIVGQNPSYAWRSIMAAVHVIKEGARRKIGDGRETSIWGLPWLPDVENGYVRTPMPIQLKDSTVYNLMEDGKRSWDFDVIHDIFQRQDVGRI